MTYNIKTFKEFRKHQTDLNHLKHMLKRPMSSDERETLDTEIENKTQTVKQHFDKLQQDILGRSNENV